MARGESGVELLVQGVERVALLQGRADRAVPEGPRPPLPLPDDSGTEVEALYRAVLELAAQGAGAGPARRRRSTSHSWPPRPATRCAWPTCSARCSAWTCRRSRPSSKRRPALEALRLMHGYLTHEVQVLELRKKINSQAQTEMSKQQREYMLRQQMQAIQQELGEKNPEKAEVEELRRRLAEADLPDEVRKEAERELTRLERLPAAAPDFQVIAHLPRTDAGTAVEEVHARTSST